MQMWMVRQLDRSRGPWDRNISVVTSVRERERERMKLYGYNSFIASDIKNLIIQAIH
jgi:hypothetical protein